MKAPRVVEVCQERVAIALEGGASEARARELAVWDALDCKRVGRLCGRCRGTTELVEARQEGLRW